MFYSSKVDLAAWIENGQKGSITGFSGSRTMRTHKRLCASKGDYAHPCASTSAHARQNAPVCTAFRQHPSMTIPEPLRAHLRILGKKPDEIRAILKPGLMGNLLHRQATMVEQPLGLQ
jgi:hypothetical protein